MTPDNSFTFSIQNMAHLTIEQIIPEKPEFTLRSGKSYMLRIANVEDQSWIKNRFKSDEELQRVFQEMQWDALSVLVFRLLEDKTDFSPAEVEEVDDDGRKIKQFISGPRMLQRAMTQGDGHKVLAALNASILLGNPELQEYVLSEVKKNLGELIQIGEKSSTSSQASTATPSSSSENSPSGKSTSRSAPSRKGKGGNSRSKA